MRLIMRSISARYVRRHFLLTIILLLVALAFFATNGGNIEQLLGIARHEMNTGQREGAWLTLALFFIVLCRLSAGFAMARLRNCRPLYGQVRRRGLSEVDFDAMLAKSHVVDKCIYAGPWEVQLRWLSTRMSFAEKARFEEAPSSMGLPPITVAQLAKQDLVRYTVLTLVVSAVYVGVAANAADDVLSTLHKQTLRTEAAMQDPAYLPFALDESGLPVTTVPSFHRLLDSEAEENYYMQHKLTLGHRYLFRIQPTFVEDTGVYYQVVVEDQDPIITSRLYYVHYEGMLLIAHLSPTYDREAMPPIVASLLPMNGVSIECVRVARRSGVEEEYIFPYALDAAYTFGFHRFTATLFTIALGIATAVLLGRWVAMLLQRNARPLYRKLALIGATVEEADAALAASVRDGRVYRSEAWVFRRGLVSTTVDSLWSRQRRAAKTKKETKALS